MHRAARPVKLKPITVQCGLSPLVHVLRTWFLGIHLRYTLLAGDDAVRRELNGAERKVEAVEGNQVDVDDLFSRDMSHISTTPT